MRLLRALVVVPALVTGLWTGVVAPSPLAAQAVMGRVVDSTTRKPLAGVPVLLVPGADSVRDTVYAVAQTAADGVFALAAPAPGTYRVRLGAAHVGPPLALPNADAVDQHEYPIAVPAADALLRAVLRGVPLDSVIRAGAPFFAFQVEKTAATVPGTLAARYPESMKHGTTTRGEVVAQFVVDTTGRADVGTFRVLRTTNAAFSDAARAGVSQARFYPAEIAHRRVRQLVQLPFTFTLVGAPPVLFPPPYRPLPNSRGDPWPPNP